MKIKFIFIFLKLFFVIFTNLLHSKEITLRPHQQYPIDYLMEKNPDQKGLLIYHGLGTGKTYLSLGFVEQYPNNKIILMMPRFLVSSWKIQMKDFGVKNPSRIEVIPFSEAPEKLKGRDLSDTVVVIDEVHRLVEKILQTGHGGEKNYGRVYYQLLKAKRLLALTGTPIFSHASNISYVANLVMGKESYTYNPELFKQDYMKINRGLSYIRGYFTESKLNTVFLPLFFTAVAFPLSVIVGPAVLGGGAVVGSMAIFSTNERLAINKIEFRSFDSEKFKDFALKYISFYEINYQQDDNFPSKKVYKKKVEYTAPQVNFFLSFVDEALEGKDLKVVLRDYEQEFTEEDISLNNHTILKQVLMNPAAGREIANLSFPKDTEDPKSPILHPIKFDKIYELIQKNKGQVAVYSNYYENGLKLFANYLKEKGMGDDYLILHPDDPVEKQIKTIESYNTAEKRIIFIHPEITEGVSLKGTRQFHILEPIENKAKEAQVIGRAVRYQSHTHLPKDEQNVSIYKWHAKISYCKFKLGPICIPNEAAFVKRRHWQKRFSEMNPSLWTYGITILDKNFLKKQESPDTRTIRNSELVTSDMNGFSKLAKKYSIEKLVN